MFTKNNFNNNNERKYKRVWSKYNQSLVKRILIFLDTSFLDKWEEELEKENNGKIGRPYEYPIEFFIFLSKIRSLWGLSFHELEAFVREISERTKKFRPMSYVSIFKRIREIPIENMVNEINKLAGEKIAVIIDSTGFKITKRGEWIANKWKKNRKGWIKIHVAIDGNSINVVSVSVTDEHRSDSKEFKNVLDPIIGKVTKVYGDKGYDSRENFNYPANNNVTPIILPRKNARTRANGSPARAKVVREINKMGVENWKESVEYGKRWRVEIFFSALKRVMGEVINAKKFIYLVQEALMKIYYYFILRKNNVVN